MPWTLDPGRWIFHHLARQDNLQGRWGIARHAKCSEGQRVRHWIPGCRTRSWLRIVGSSPDQPEWNDEDIQGIHCPRWRGRGGHRGRQRQRLPGRRVCGLVQMLVLSGTREKFVQRSTFWQQQEHTELDPANSSCLAEQAKAPGIYKSYILRNYMTMYIT